MGAGRFFRKPDFQFRAFGASAPEVLVHAVIARLNALGAVSVRELQGIAGRVTFPLPKALAG